MVGARAGGGLPCGGATGGTFSTPPQIWLQLGGCFNVVPPPCRSALPQPLQEAVGGLLQEPGQLPLHPLVVEEVSQGLVAIAPLIGACQVMEESPSPAGAQPVPLAIAHRLQVTTSHLLAYVASAPSSVETRGPKGSVQAPIDGLPYLAPGQVTQEGTRAMGGGLPKPVGGEELIKAPHASPWRCARRCWRLSRCRARTSSRCR
jgi:hypothetical protein